MHYIWGVCFSFGKNSKKQVKAWFKSLILQSQRIYGLFLQALEGLLQAKNLSYNSLADSVNAIFLVLTIFVTGRMNRRTFSGQERIVFVFRECKL